MMLHESIQSAYPGFRWKTYFFLLVLVLFGAIGIIPYMFKLTGEARPLEPLPFAVLVFLQAYITSAVLAFAGMKMSTRTGLGTPIFNLFFYGNTAEKKSITYWNIIFSPIILGCITGTAIIFIDYLFYFAGLRIELTSGGSIPSWWEGILASFYGGVAEEIMLRLFFMNFLVWIVYRIKKKTVSEGYSSKFTIISAIIISSVLFAFGHLPVVANTMNLTPLLFIRTLTLNILPGLVFGFLYYKNGLFSAVISHFSADIILHVLFPLIQGK